MAKKGKTFPQLGRNFGKPDLERLGLFIEMPYMNGKGYVSPFPSKVVVSVISNTIMMIKISNMRERRDFDSLQNRLLSRG